MIEWIRINDLFEEDVGRDLLDRLVAVHPDGSPPGRPDPFTARLPRHDPRAAELLRTLAAAGYRPWTDTRHPIDRRREFPFEIDRQYDADDLDACRYLELRPIGDANVPHTIGRWDHDGRSRLVVEEYYLPDDKWDVMATQGTWIFVTRRAADLIRQSGLNGPTLTPAFFYTQAVADDEPGAELPALSDSPFFELDSPHTMPPLSPAMTLTDADGRPAPPGDEYANGFLRREGSYAHPELHYRAADLAAVDGVDLARTREVFGLRGGRHGRHEVPPFDQPLVASHRFYRFCADRGLRADWIPVRVDP